MSKPDRLGNWVLEEALGKGGMGSVYRAHHAFLTRQRVALKWVQFVREDTAARFEREVEALLAVGQHPHLAQVRSFDVLPDGSGGLLAMDLVDGRPIRGPLPEEEVLELLIQIGSALSHAHASGVIHRDVKPSNILHSPTLGYVLVDFGIARRGTDTRLTTTGDFVGTLEYTAPEVWNFEREPSHESLQDIYALGQVAYEMLTGERAIPATGPGRDPVAWVAHRKSRAISLDVGNRGRMELVDLIKRATEPDPHRRLDSAERLVQQALEIRDPVARTPEGPTAKWRTDELTWLVALLGALGIAGLLGSALGLMVLGLAFGTSEDGPPTPVPIPTALPTRQIPPAPAPPVTPAPTPRRAAPSPAPRRTVERTIERPVPTPSIHMAPDPTLRRVTLVGGDGARHVLPTRLPPGSYEIHALFADDTREVPAGEVVVETSDLQLTCTAAFKLCAVGER